MSSPKQRSARAPVPGTGPEQDAARDRRRDAAEATRGHASRARLVEAAISSVARYGLEGTTISRLMDVSGVSRGLISFHFDGKDKLIEAALEHAIVLYEKSWEEAVILPDMTAEQRLHAVVDHDIDFANDAPDILSLWWAAWGEARGKSIYRRSSAARDERFVADLARMFRKSGLSPKRAGEAAYILNAALMGVWLQHHLEEDAAALQSARAAAHMLVDRLLQ